MDALIMAAGRGSRLGSHTDDRPKSLIDLGGISPLELQLELLARRGIERAILVTGYRREMVESVARERAAGRLRVEPVWNPFWSVTNVVGSAWMARDELVSPFVYLHADTVFEPSILDDLLGGAGAARLPVDFRPCEPEQMKAAVVDDRITHLSKDLPPERTAGEFIGIGVFEAEALPYVRAGLDAVMADGGLGGYFEAALNHAIDRGLDVRAVPTAGRAWTEIDFEPDLALARTLLPRLLPEPPGATT
ncbi:MAG: phosphocholine cytidylyltransferase family protein [Chloroflexi bacterium]|nr:phosphocholine cytidylyltransferase family protein [Chloroflexota bacterium]